ncbi:hypothetical protein NUACC26_099090 [Scytonema sp. NUACC26]
MKTLLPGVIFLGVTSLFLASDKLGTACASRSLAAVRSYIIYFDVLHDHYQLLRMGWTNSHKRVFNPILHLDIIEGKVWIQENRTDIDIGEELFSRGVPKSDIVLGLHPPEGATLQLRVLNYLVEFLWGGQYACLKRAERPFHKTIIHVLQTTENRYISNWSRGVSSTQWRESVVYVIHKQLRLRLSQLELCWYLVLELSGEFEKSLSRKLYLLTDQPLDLGRVTQFR